jgi:hypothetical protein
VERVQGKSVKHLDIIIAFVMIPVFYTGLAFLLLEKDIHTVRITLIGITCPTCILAGGLLWGYFTAPVDD